MNTFLNEFATYVESLIMCLEPILITGHSAFLDLLDSLNLEQHVRR